VRFGSPCPVLCRFFLARLTRSALLRPALRRDVGESEKTVIGISTVLTWARCPKPVRLFVCPFVLFCFVVLVPVAWDGVYATVCLGRAPCVTVLCVLVRQAEDEKLSEDNYKRRKPSPKYADQRAVESYIMNLAREGVQSTVVAAGIMYGAGEDMLHSIVKVRVPDTHTQCL